MPNIPCPVETLYFLLEQTLPSLPEVAKHEEDVCEDNEIAEDEHTRILEGLPLKGLEEHSVHICHDREITELTAVRYDLEKK